MITKKELLKAAKEIAFEMKDNRIPFYFMANTIQQDEQLIKKLFVEMIEDKEIDAELDPTGVYLVFKKPEITCPACNADMSKEQKTCMECGYQLQKCIVCKLYIRELPVQCPNCKSFAHEQHLLRWLEFNDSTCPACNAQVVPSDLIKKEPDLYKSYFKGL